MNDSNEYVLRQKVIPPNLYDGKRRTTNPVKLILA